MMAGWDVGGTEMSRSLSDSAVPPPRAYDTSVPREPRKRHFRHLHHLDITHDYQAIPEWKRPRLCTHYDEYAMTRCHHQPVPPFFIIKEASSTQMVDSRSLDRHHSAHFDTAHQYQYDSMSAYDLAYDLRVRNDEAPMSNVRSLETKEMKHNVHHDAAAALVEADMADYRRRRRRSQHERILKSIISPKVPSAEFEIDDEWLQGIFYAVNEIFFRGSLKGRVTWIWKDLETNLIGTTAWRDAPDGHGYETLIYLSKQILKNKKYNRRLLIATFIHELIHSYLFVYCGYHPDDCGGHTSGFKRIAKLINDWVGEENLLQLHKMEAELSDFETSSTDTLPRSHVSGGCQVQWLRDGTLGYIVLRSRDRAPALGG